MNPLDLVRMMATEKIEECAVCSLEACRGGRYVAFDILIGKRAICRSCSDAVHKAVSNKLARETVKIQSPHGEMVEDATGMTHDEAWANIEGRRVMLPSLGEARTMSAKDAKRWERSLREMGSDDAVRKLLKAVRRRLMELEGKAR